MMRMRDQVPVKLPGMNLILRPEKMIHGGRALARLKDGRVALVRGALPGETVRAQLEPRKGVLQGWVSEVLEPSEDRVEAPAHPGLDYGFITYERQLALKRAVVGEALLRATGREREVPPVRAAPEQWHYRSTVQPVALRRGNRRELGYRRPESREAVALPRDPVALAGINTLWQRWPDLSSPKGVRELVIRANGAGDLLVSLIATTSAKNLLDFAHDLLAAGVTGVGYAPLDKRGRFRSGSERLAGARTIRQRYGRFTVSVSAAQFAQPNPSAASALYEALVNLAPPAELALDLYAGSGVIGMHLLAKAERVIALEIDRGSVVRGQRDAERLGLEGLEFRRSDAKHLKIPPGTNLISLDPPRAGLNKALRETLNASGVPRLLYVSCDVATWARDIAEFEAAGWTLAHLEPFDFYPHTHHTELLSYLERG